MLAPGEVSLELVDELARLEPFGLGNPGVTLLAPAATLRGVGAIGEGTHLRATVELGGFRCGAVGFGMGPRADALQSGGPGGRRLPAGPRTSGTARSLRRCCCARWSRCPS